MTGCLLTKLCLGLSVITTIVYTIAFASPYWLQKDFSLEVPGYMISGLPDSLNASMIPVTVHSNMGLLASCDDISVWVIPGYPPKNSLDCGSDGARDWQYAAAGCGIAAFVIAVISTGLSTTVVFLDRRPFYNKLRVAAVVGYFLTCVSLMISIILYANKREFQVKPPLPNREKYDLYWAFYTASATDILFAALATLHLIEIFVSIPEWIIHAGLSYFFGLTPVNAEHEKDPSASYRMDDKVPSA